MRSLLGKILVAACIFITALPFASGYYGTDESVQKVDVQNENFWKIGYKLTWRDPTDWNKGTVGTGLAVSGNYLQLEEYTDLDDDFDYETPGEYTLSNTDTLEVTAGELRLKSISGNETDYTFTSGSDYTYSNTDITITGGVATLLGVSNIYAHYHLNEAAGANISDVSGFERHGTTSGSTAWVAAKLNNGLELSAGEYGNLGDIASFARAQAFSAELWYKGTGAGTLIGRRQNGGLYRGWDIMYSAGKLYFYFASTTVSNMISVYTTVTIDDDAWHHIAVTYAGTSLASGVNIYVDGVLKTPTIQYNTLSDTATTTTYLHLGARAGSNIMQGTYDEVVIYDRVITPAEVTARYNSGSGTEEGGYSLTNPTIVNNTPFIFSANLSAFIETATIPSGSGLKYHLSTDGGGTWIWWNGDVWTTTDDSYTQANTAAEVNADIASLAASGNFSFRALLHSDSGYAAPELDNIHVTEPITYSTVDNFYADTTNTNQIDATEIIGWLSTNISNTKPASTDLRVLFSNDGRTSWLGWNGDSWAAPTSNITRTDATSITDAEANFASFPLGSKLLDARTFLYTSDGLVRPTIENINVVGNDGYASSGNWESNVVDSGDEGTIWDTFRRTISTTGGATITIKARAANTVDAVAAASYSLALSNAGDLEDDYGITGRYIQFKAEFSGSGDEAAVLEEMRAYYYGYYGSEVNP